MPGGVPGIAGSEVPTAVDGPLTKGRGWPLSLGRCESLRYLWKFMEVYSLKRTWNHWNMFHNVAMLVAGFYLGRVAWIFSIDWTFQVQIIQSHSSRFKMRRSTWVKSPLTIHTLAERRICSDESSLWVFPEDQSVVFFCIHKTKAWQANRIVSSILVKSQLSRLHLSVWPRNFLTTATEISRENGRKETCWTSSVGVCWFNQGLGKAHGFGIMRRLVPPKYFWNGGRKSLRVLVSNVAFI
jgi:hypothetical protein